MTTPVAIRVYALMYVRPSGDHAVMQWFDTRSEASQVSLHVNRLHYIATRVANRWINHGH